MILLEYLSLKPATILFRITNKEGELEKEREVRLKEWQTKFQAMVTWIEGRENKQQDSGDFDHNLDGVRKELALVKVGLCAIDL